MLFCIVLFFSVDIFCDVITGVFNVSSKGGNGHKGQNGGDGRAGTPATNVSSSLKSLLPCKSTAEEVSFK